jgi:FkbM family methyltransferase
VKKAVFAAIVLLLGAILTARFVAPEKSDIAWRVLSGESPYCPMPLALATPEEQKAQVAVKDEFIDVLKLGADDEAFDRWDLPAFDGHAARFYWIPKGNRWVLPFNLAEQARDIYQTKGEWGIREGDIVLDCGAHVGTFTQTALSRGAAKVIAIEPSPRNVECLRRNFPKEIESGRVVIYPKGVWNKDDTMVLEKVHDNSAADTVVMHQPGAADGERVPLTTIDKLVAELGLTRVDYIKMDIEGAEVPALQGAASTIPKWKPRLALAAYHKLDDPVTIPAAVDKLAEGYTHRCGSCVMDDAGVRPEVLLFQAPR